MVYFGKGSTFVAVGSGNITSKKETEKSSAISVPQTLHRDFNLNGILKQHEEVNFLNLCFFINLRCYWGGPSGVELVGQTNRMGPMGRGQMLGRGQMWLRST